MSLIARMIIPISVIVTLATSFIGWKAYSDARDSVAEATRILEISTLDAVGRELTTVMNLTRQHLLTVADRIAIIELLRNPDESPEGERSKLLTRHLRRAVLDFPSIDGLAVLNSRGTVIASVNPGENATSRKTSSYFHKALQGAQTLDGPLVLPYTQEKAFIISTPIYDRGKVSGVLVGAINMEHLTRLIVDPVTLNGMGYVFVCTPGGSVIMHRDRNKMFADNVSEQRFIKEATADKDRFLEYRNPQGQIMYSAYTALPNGWIIVAAASKEAMLAGVRNLRSDIILSCVGALLLVTHDRWFLDEVCESMWEVHDGEIEPFEGGYSAYMLQRVERDRQADVRETKRRNLARKELAWLTRGARARSTKQKFHVKAARELIADVPPVRNTLELKQMATSRLGKQVVDLIDVTQIFEHVQGEADIDPDVADMEASASRVDVVPAMYAEPQVHGSVEVAVDDLTDPRLVDAGVAAAQVAAAAKESQEIQESQENNTDDSAEEITSAAQKITVTGRKILDDVTWLIGPGDRFGIVGANGAGKSTLLKILDGTITPTVGHVNIGKTVKFAVLSQRLDELEKLGKYKIKEVLSRYKPSYIVDGKETTPGQMMERLGFESAQLMTPIKDLSGGQKRRMQLLLILLDEPNVLIMDEPGNDLDTDMLAVMEDLLDTWPGTLIVVSHDRYLLERVTDQQFALIGGKIRHLPGGVQDYLDMTEAIKNGKNPFADEKAGAGKGKRGGSAGTAGSTTEGTAGNSASGSATAETASSAPSTPKLSGKAFHEASKRVSAIERKLAKLEEQKADLEQQMAAHDPSDYEGLGKLNDQLQAVTDESEELELEWMELSEQLE